MNDSLARMLQTSSARAGAGRLRPWMASIPGARAIIDNQSQSLGYGSPNPRCLSACRQPFPVSENLSRW
jgi:hypothetical protein